jgi:hypothetical protein
MKVISQSNIKSYIPLLQLFLLFSLFSLVNAEYLHAQTLGITTTGTSVYPQTSIGSTATATGNNAGNYLIVNQFTSNVPLTAIAIRTFGTASGNVKVSIYNDNGSDYPGTLLFTEVASAVTANTTSTITIPNIYLPAAKYWLAYNMNSASASANYITKNTGVSCPVRKSLVWTYGTSFPISSSSWVDLAAGMQDNICFTGVQTEGYAKATKAVLPLNGSFSSLSFYSHASGNARFAIYNNSGGAPSAKQWESDDVVVSANAWTTININTGTPSSLILASGTYWLVWQWNSANNGPSYTAGSVGDGNYMIRTTYGSFPSTWLGGTSTAEKWSIYATYCNTPPIPVAGNNGPVCSGSPLLLSASAISGATYLWTGPNGFTSTLQNPTVSGSATTAMAGTYYVTATVGGCSSLTGSTTAVVLQTSVSVNGQTNISCFGGNDGTITILASGGSAPYQFSVNNGAAYTSGNNPYTFSGLSANIQYKIRAKDSNGCESPIIP